MPYLKTSSLLDEVNRVKRALIAISMIYQFINDPELYFTQPEKNYTLNRFDTKNRHQKVLIIFCGTIVFSIRTINSQSALIYFVEGRGKLYKAEGRDSGTRNVELYFVAICFLL